MSRTCSECFFHSKLMQQCRKYPPKAQVAGVDRQGQPVIATYYPTISKPNEEWCGEFLADLPQQKQTGPGSLVEH